MKVKDMTKKKIDSGLKDIVVNGRYYGTVNGTGTELQTRTRVASMFPRLAMSGEDYELVDYPFSDGDL